MKKGKFVKWLFEKRDVDGLIIAFLISASVNSFIASLTKSVVDPIIEGVLPKTDEKTEQVLNINNYFVFRFKLQYLLSGIIRLLITLSLAFLMVKYVYRFLDLE